MQEYRAFEDLCQPNLEEAQPINLGTLKDVHKTKVNTHIDVEVYGPLVQALHDCKEEFAWSYDDMPGLDPGLAAHKLPILPGFKPFHQIKHKFKTDISERIQE